MNNQFDERLVSRISDVFDNYEDNFADEGWKELRKKFPVKQQRSPLIYWIGSAAAAIILAIGIWAVLPTQEVDDTTIAKVNTPKEEPLRENDMVPSAQTEPALENNSTTGRFGTTATAKKENTRLAYSSVPARKGERALNVVDVIPEGTENFAAAQAVAPLDSKESTTSLIAASNEIRSTVKSASETDVLTSSTDASAAQKKRTFMEMAREEDSKSTETQHADKKITFGVYAGSFVSYAQGSENNVNLGAGFTSDIALSKRLKLSTGISIAQNTLSFASSSDIPTVAQANFKAAFAQDADPLSFRQPIMYNLDKYDATLLGVDIPVNLKYSLSDKKRDMFVSAGFSSGAFINESYTYHYSSASTMESSLPAGSVEATPVQNEDKLKKDFGNFDVARMLNLSFGIGYQVGRQQKLVIEPFVRYPLKGIGAENLRFGAGGVNLKLNFETNRKR